MRRDRDRLTIRREPLRVPILEFDPAPTAVVEPSALTKGTATTMGDLDLPRLLTSLGEERPVFHAEADFQHALAWSIHGALPAAAVRLEVPAELDGRRVHVDVWIESARERVAIELKYFTRALDVRIGRERFWLRDQAAQDLGRYDILKDLARVESLVAAGTADRGYVIALTNDSSYWKGPYTLSSPNYAALRLMEGRELAGTLGWGPRTGAGTMRGREAPITLRSVYRCAWSYYSQLGAELPRGRFRYLMFEIEPMSPG